MPDADNTLSHRIVKDKTVNHSVLLCQKYPSRGDGGDFSLDILPLMDAMDAFQFLKIVLSAIKM